MEPKNTRIAETAILEWCIHNRFKINEDKSI